MGTTLIVVAVVNGRVYASSVGDAKASHVDAYGQIRGTTREHSVAAENVERTGNPNYGVYCANVITQMVGFVDLKTLKPDHQVFPLTPGDWIFVATDGAWDANLRGHTRSVLRHLDPSEETHLPRVELCPSVLEEHFPQMRVSDPDWPQSNGAVTERQIADILSRVRAGRQALDATIGYLDHQLEQGLAKPDHRAVGLFHEPEAESSPVMDWSRPFQG